MSKAQRIRQQNAREKIAAQRAAEQRAQRRRRTLIAGGSVLAVLAVVAVLIGVKLASSGGSGGSSNGTAQPAVVSAVTSMTPRPRRTPSARARPTPKMLIPLSGAPALTTGGKPEVLYMGAEYCPFCATERWAMLNALRAGSARSRTSASSTRPRTSTPASVPTLTFYQSGYERRQVRRRLPRSRCRQIDRSALREPDVRPEGTC